MKTLGAKQDLEKAVPFLLARAGAPMGNALARALKPFGISWSEWRVCASLQHSPSQALIRKIVPLAQHYEAVALSGFSAAEVKTLRAMLLRLYRNATPLA